MWVRKTGEDAPTSRQSWPVFLDGGQQDTELGLGGGWGWGVPAACWAIRHSRGFAWVGQGVGDHPRGLCVSARRPFLPWSPQTQAWSSLRSPAPSSRPCSFLFAGGGVAMQDIVLRGE